jgi:periplasmic divalent cation tolerance protein
MTCIAVVTTVGSREQAQLIAGSLVERRLAACAQISEIDSYYVWHGTVQHEPEWRVLVKTTADQYEVVEAAIRELHSYELPAIHAYPFARTSEPYGEWIAANSRGS